MSSFLKQLKRNQPPSPPYVPLRLECPKCTFITHELSKLKMHIKSQHSPNYAPIPPKKTPTYIETMPVFICNVRGCYYYAHQLSNINEHIQRKHEDNHEKELRTDHRSPASPSPKGGKRKTHCKNKSRSRRITKRKTQRRK